MTSLDDKHFHLYKKYKMKYLSLQQGGNICSNLSKKQTKIYYISNYVDLSKGNTFTIDSKTVKLYTFDQILGLTGLNSIINCIDNIYIYIENIDKTTTQTITGTDYSQLIDHKNKELADHINKELKTKESSPDIYKNVTIVNFTNTTEYVIYTLIRDKISLFRKIVNIFPLKIYTNIHNFEIDINRNKMINENSISKDKDAKFLTYTYHGGNITKYITSKLIKFNDYSTIKVRDIEKIKLYISSYWWYEYYFGIPYCAYGRLLQSTGTCWCNGLINLLFLTDKIKEKLIKTYNQLEKTEKDVISKITLKDFTGSKKNHPLKHLLLALVNIILINREKASETDANIIAILAAKIKGLSTGEHDDNYNFYQKQNIKYGDGHSTFNGLYVINDILKLPFTFLLYTIKDDEANRKIKSDIKSINEEASIYINETCLEIKKLLKEKSDNELALLSKEKKEYDRKISEENKKYDKNILEEKKEYDRKISEENKEYDKNILEEKKEYDKNILEEKIKYKDKDKKITFDQYTKNVDDINKRHVENNDNIHKRHVENNDNIHKRYVENNDNIHKRYVEKFDDINKRHVENNDNIHKFNDDKLKAMKQKYIDYYNIYSKSIQDKKLQILEIKKITSLSAVIDKSRGIIYNYETSDLTLITDDSIIVIECNELIDIAEPTIIINGKTYKLLGSVLTNGNHTICGLICDDKYYVYDSNNIIAYTDWHKGNLSGYYKKLPVSFLLETIYHINFLVYGL